MHRITLRIEKRAESLPKRLQEHLHRASEIAVRLAPLHGLDPRLAHLGCMAHDIAKAIPDQEMLRQAARFGLPVNPVERNNPGLLHGAVGAELLRHEEGLEDQSIYQAVCWHTFAHPGLDPLGKIVLLADKLDPAKARRYTFQPYLMELAQENLDRAVLEFVTRQIVAIIEAGRMVHPLMVEARNHLIAAGVKPERSAPETVRP